MGYKFVVQKWVRPIKKRRLRTFGVPQLKTMILLKKSNRFHDHLNINFKPASKSATSTIFHTLSIKTSMRFYDGFNNILQIIFFFRVNQKW